MAPAPEPLFVLRNPTTSQSLQQIILRLLDPASSDPDSSFHSELPSKLLDSWTYDTFSKLDGSRYKPYYGLFDFIEPERSHAESVNWFVDHALRLTTSDLSQRWWLWSLMTGSLDPHRQVRVGR